VVNCRFVGKIKGQHSVVAYYNNNYKKEFAGMMTSFLLAKQTLLPKSKHKDKMAKVTLLADDEGSNANAIHDNERKAKHDKHGYIKLKKI
jgi:hypothetical protein